MSEAPAEPTPVEEPFAPPEPEPAALAIRLDWDRLDAGDLEDMEDYCGRPVFGLLQEAISNSPDGGQSIMGLLAVLPSKVFTALLGVAKRHQDPTFGPDQWRSIRLSELAGPVPFEGEEPPEEPPAELTPIRGSTGKRGSGSGIPTGSRRTSRPG